MYGGSVSSDAKLSFFRKRAQQSVHLTLGILRTSQAVSHALAFFWLDGFAVPAPAQVTQTVGLLRRKYKSFQIIIFLHLGITNETNSLQARPI